jgi:hypothetical protein
MAEPIALYRFLDSDAALKTLVARKFRVGRLSNFNDPFEWQVGGSGKSPEERTSLDRLRRDCPAWLDSWMEVLCFSDCVSDPVLWSLYADKHRGVAFEVKYSWKEDHMHKMTYPKERPVLDTQTLRKIPDGKERDEHLLSVINRLMTGKSSGWSFEREHRAFIDIHDTKHCQLSDDGWHYWQIPDNFLVRVILGFRCPLDEAVVRKLLDLTGLAETRVVRAQMCPDTYAIKC